MKLLEFTGSYHMPRAALVYRNGAIANPTGYRFGNYEGGKVFSAHDQDAELFLGKVEADEENHIRWLNGWVEPLADDGYKEVKEATQEDEVIDDTVYPWEKPTPEKPTPAKPEKPAEKLSKLTPDTKESK